MKIVVTLLPSLFGSVPAQDEYPGATSWIVCSSSLEIRKDSQTVAQYANGTWASVKKVD